MNRIITYLLVFTCSAVAAEETDTSPVFKSSDTRSIIAKEGQKITVRGLVSSVRKSNGGTNFINFDTSEFYLITFKSDLNTFVDGEPADLYQGKHLAVTGVVSVYKNKPQMKLLHPDMVRIINADEPLPATKNKKKRDTSKNKIVPETSKKNKSEKKKNNSPVDPKKYFK